MIRSGFFNSRNHDKLYYNSDISRLFNALIIDGVFQNIGDKFIARPGTGMQVIIPSGMAYFNSTWIFNDADYVQAIDAAPIVAGFSRIDGIFLKMGPEDDLMARENSIYYMAGTPASQDVQRPVPASTDGEVYIPVCYVTVEADVTEITAAKITNMVGTDSCPFITGILETIDATELLTQWEAQWNEWLNTEKTDFDEWFETIKGILDSDVAGHLQLEIDEINAKENSTAEFATTSIELALKGLIDSFASSGTHTGRFKAITTPNKWFSYQIDLFDNVASGYIVNTLDPQESYTIRYRRQTDEQATLSSIGDAISQINNDLTNKQAKLKKRTVTINCSFNNSAIASGSFDISSYGFTEILSVSPNSAVDDIVVSRWGCTTTNASCVMYRPSGAITASVACTLTIVGY